jgi:putative spermidine/putrescine transport system substrate-binding protein
MPIFGERATDHLMPRARRQVAAQQSHRGMSIAAVRVRNEQVDDMRKHSRRAALKGLGSLAVAAGAMSARSVLAAPAMHKGTVLTVSCWGGDVQDSIKKYVEPEFTRQSGATLAYDIGGMGARYSKILAQRANAQTDVFFCTDEAVVSGLKAGVLTTATRKNLSNLPDVEPSALTLNSGVPPDMLGAMPYCILALGMAYNPEVVKQAPTSWADLWKPEFAGQTTFISPVHSMMPGMIVALAELFGGSEKNVEPAFKKLAELRPVKLTVAPTDWNSLLKSGDIRVAVEFDSYTDGLKMQKYPIAYAFPKEKALGTIDVVAIVKGTRSQELSELFLDLIADKNVQAGFAADSYVGPINRKTELSAEVKARCNCGAQPNQVRFFDPAMSAAMRPAWTERLNIEVVPNWKTR